VEIEPMQDKKKHENISLWAFVYAVDMAIACFVAYWIMTYGLSRFVD
jgi:hypothetical protein